MEHQPMAAAVPAAVQALRRRTLKAAAAAAIALGAGGIALPLQAQAQASFPSGPVKLTAPFPAGSGPDAVMRLLAEKLAERWKQPVIVDNRPGASGFLALEAAKRAAPTGLELLVADVGNLSVNPSLYRKLPYDAERDFAPVSVIYRTNFFIAVAANSPYRNVKDITTAAAAASNKVIYGSNGNGSPLHLGAAQLAYATQTQMLHVPYKEISALFTSVSNGEVDFALASIGSAGALRQSGKLRFIAVGDTKRAASLPDVPTMEEAGGPKLTFDSWVALLAPAGTPEAVVTSINKAVVEAMKKPDVQKRMELLGFSASTTTPRELGALIHAERERYAEVIKRAGVTTE